MLKTLPSRPSKELKALFQEDWYLAAHEDLGVLAKEGGAGCGWRHFYHHGYAEGRAAFPFDVRWYLEAYPQAVIEIENGLARTPQDHYARYGAARGYLPIPTAERPDNASAIRPRFGGLWIDAPNAEDQIQGRLEIGYITEAEAEQLRRFREDGYIILHSAIEPDLLEKARSALERAYGGGYQDLKFECNSITREHIAWRPDINGYPSKALDIHMFSADMRELMFANRVRRFLNILFECQPYASQSLGFLRGSAQESHQDSAYVAYTVPRQFAASWIALEDVTANAGELFYYPGSHNLPDYLYGKRYKSASEARRNNYPAQALSQEIREHVASLDSRAAEMGISREAFMAKAGDVLIWHADLAHGGLPVSSDVTRKSLVTHYCPRFLSPLYTEAGSRKCHEHPSGGWFTSGIYPGMTPRDDA